MAHTDSRGGTLIIDRVLRSVGRVKRASGTTNPAVHRKVNRMLSALADDGRIDILRALRDGHLDFLATLDAYQRRALDTLPMGATAAPLAETMRAWGQSYECSEEYRGAIETSVRYLERHEAGAPVADLPRVVEELRATLGAKHPRSWNMLRANCLAFVRDRFKRNHPLWLALAATEKRKQPKPEPGVRLTVAEMRGFFPYAGGDGVDAQVDAIAWGMVTTGMLPKEFWGRWSVKADRIHIHGTKREGRVRDVPLVLRPAPPALHDRTFADKVRERTNRTVRPKDLRGTYSHWMEMAGIPRTRRRMYMGHGKRDVTDLYEQHEVAAFLVEDAAKLRAYLGLSADSGGLKLEKSA